MSRFSLFVLIMVCAYGSSAQPLDSAVFPFNAFYQLVINNHPIVKQAAILPQEAALEVRLARGSFDPKIGLSWYKKDFEDKEYYNKLNAVLKVPTWVGLTAEAGVEQNQGQFLNPESFISESTGNQQYYAGVSIPLGKGLFIDQRRATLRQAQIFSTMAEVEQVKLLNKLLLEAAKDYWEWYLTYKNFDVVRRSVTMAEDILARTRLGFEYGELAAIDTIQVQTNLMTRRAELLEAQTARQRAEFQLATHLWNADNEPLELNESTKPEEVLLSELTTTLLAELVDLAKDNHPELVKLKLKRDVLNLENKWVKEQLKPQLDLKYVVLDQPLRPDGEIIGLSLADNYKVGVDFSFPLFLRKERAKVRQTSLKLQHNQLDLMYKSRTIVNDINAHYTEMINVYDIINQQQQIVGNYEQIVAAERLNLENGESDLFRLNAQLDKLYAGQVKLNKTIANYQKGMAYLYWLSGVANLGFE